MSILSSKCGPVATARSPSLEAGFDQLHISGQPQPVPVQAPVTAIQATVQRAYTQADFEREDAALKQRGSLGERVDFSKHYFSQIVYDKADGAIAQCIGRQTDSNITVRDGSTRDTNYTILVLNALLRKPLRKLGPNATTEQVGQIYQRVMKLLPKSTEEFSPGDQKWLIPSLRSRAMNLSSIYYSKEMTELVKYLIGTKQVKTTKEAIRILVNEPIGSFAHAIACEVFRLCCLMNRKSF